MEILAIVSFFVLIVLAKKRTAGIKSFRLRLVVWLLMIGIPLVIFFADELIGQAYLNTMCRQYGGYKYGEPIKTEGYFAVDNKRGCELGCIEALTRWKYKYYEVEVHSRDAYHSKGKGIYHYYLVDKTDGHCAGGRAIPREKSILPDDKCVAYSLLREPISKYEVSMIQSTDVKSFYGRVDKVYSYVKDRKTGELLGSATSFRYWGGWVRRHPFEHNSATVCPSFEDSHAAIFNMIITSTN
jgi:hypothetical protein